VIRKFQGFSGDEQSGCLDRQPSGDHPATRGAPFSSRGRTPSPFDPRQCGQPRLRRSSIRLLSAVLAGTNLAVGVNGLTGKSSLLPENAV
jgi:hypothetical protein